MIKKEGKKFVLYTKDGSKKLGEHDSEADAQKQEAAIEISKHKAASAKGFRSLLAAVEPLTLARKPSKDEHPFTYCMQVVIPAIEAKQGAVDDPEAFCGWWKGEREYEAAMAALSGKEARHVHLMGATGQIRTATFEQVEYMVVPVVALMEGVIHAINAETPEYVPLACLACAPQGWNGRPVVLGHPVRDGKQISANSPEVLEAQAFGKIFGSKLQGQKLMLEAWIDPKKAEAIGAQDLVERLRANRMCEVSVGAFVVTDPTSGMYGDKPYKAVWRDIVPDHLAFLPKGLGACSNEMGCGAPRAAMAHMFVDDDIITLASPKPLPDKAEVADPHTADDYEAMAVKADKDGDTKGAVAYRKKAKDMRGAQTPNGMAAEEKAELIAYQTLRTLYDQMQESWDASSDIINDLIADEEENPTLTQDEEDAETEVEEARVESLQVLCMSMYSTLNAVMNLTSDLLKPDVPDMGEASAPRYMAGARHSASDRQIIQRVHDHAVSLGADCSTSRMASAQPPRENQPQKQPVTPPAEGRAMACTCGNKDKSGGEAKMTVEQRSEIIKSLIGDKHSGFVAADEKMLEAASDERLDAFRVAAQARAKEVEKPAKTEPTAAETKNTLTEDDFMKVAPDSLKTLIARAQKQDTEHKAALVAGLKSAQAEYSESELAAMSIESLERLARVAGVQQEPAQVSYAGRGIPRAAADGEKKDVYANPPDPYADALKALRAKDGLPERVAVQ